MGFSIIIPSPAASRRPLPQGER